MALSDSHTTLKSLLILGEVKEMKLVSKSVVDVFYIVLVAGKSIIHLSSHGV